MKIKTMSLVVVCLFLISSSVSSVTADTPAAGTADLVEYCGYTAAPCNVWVKIQSLNGTPYLVGLYESGTGNPILGYTLHSIAPTPGSSSVFAIDVSFQSCQGWYRYTGSAYCTLCEYFPGG